MLEFQETFLYSRSHQFYYNFDFFQTENENFSTTKNFLSMPFSNRITKSAGLTLVEQKFHLSDGTFFRMLTTQFWTEVTNFLLYDLIQGKETFESDHVYKLEISISPLNEFKTVRIKRDYIKLPSNSSLGIVICLYFGPLFTLKQLAKSKWNCFLSHVRKHLLMHPLTKLAIPFTKASPLSKTPVTHVSIDEIRNSLYKRIHQ